MIKVRFPTGVTVTYNDATEVERLANSRTQLIRSDAAGKRWIVAEVPAECIVEFTYAARIENPVAAVTTESAVRLLLQSDAALRSAPPYLVGKLKSALIQFNAKTHQWRNQ